MRGPAVARADSSYASVARAVGVSSQYTLCHHPPSRIKRSFQSLYAAMWCGPLRSDRSSKFPRTSRAAAPT